MVLQDKFVMDNQPALLAQRKPSLIERTRPALLLITGIISVIYANSFLGEFHFDDACNITENFNIRRISRLGNYFLTGKRPLAYLSFALNYKLHGLELFGYHLFNILVHIIASIALYFFLKGTFALPSVPERIRTRSALLAFISVLIWAINPIHTMAITYIVQRMASMAAMFYFLAFLSYLKARTSDTPARGRILLGLTVALYLCAILSKQNTAMLPIMILLYEFVFFQSADPSFFRRNIPTLIIGAVTVLLSAYYLRYGLPFVSGSETDHYKHTLKLLNRHPFTIFERLLTEPRVLFHYLSLFLVPIGYNPESEMIGCGWKGFYFRLNLDHDFPISRGLFSPPETFFTILIILLFCAYALTHPRKRPVISFFILWFFINNIIEHTIIPLAPIFEYRAYLPSVAFAVLLGILLTHITANRVRLQRVILILLVIVYGSLTIGRNIIYSDRLLIAKDTTMKSPYFARAYMRLANAYANLDEQHHPGKHFLALKAINEGLKHAAENELARGNLLLIKASLLCDIKKTDHALTCAKEALHLLLHKTKVYILLGRIYTQKKNYRLARDYFYKAAKANVSNFDGFTVQLNYSTCLRNLGNLHICRKILLKLKKGYPDEHIKIDLNLGIVDANMGNKNSAIHYFRTAAGHDKAAVPALKPVGINHLKLARARKDHNKGNAGIIMLEFYLKHFPQDPEAYKYLADYYVWSGNLPRAEECLLKSHKFRPKNTDALEGLLFIAKEQKNHEKITRYTEKLITAAKQSLKDARKRKDRRMITHYKNVLEKHQPPHED